MKRSVLDTTGANRIAAERSRQVSEEGWTATHDDSHDDAELALAAACYAARAANVPIYAESRGRGYVRFYDPFPWDTQDDKRPSKRPTIAERLRLLEKAGALCAAEIDRLLRRKAKR